MLGHEAIDALSGFLAQTYVHPRERLRRARVSFNHAGLHSEGWPGYLRAQAQRIERDLLGVDTDLRWLTDDRVRDLTARMAQFVAAFGMEAASPSPARPNPVA